MNKEEEQKKIWQSQGMKLSRPEVITAPTRNKIEEVMKHLPPLTKPSAPVAPTKKEISSDQENKRTWRFFIMILMLLIFIPALVLGSLLIYKQIKQPATVDNTQLVKDVGKVIQLPAGETPTIATITDLKPLADEPFFKDALVGDKVLIYASSSEAVLYRPSTKKVIVVGPTK
jgi:hypothetical protein